MNIGEISQYINKKTILLLIIQFSIIVLILGYKNWEGTSIECIKCHNSKERLEQLNTPWAYVTQKMVEVESHHPNIECRDCHLGNGRAKDKDAAHKGMLKMLIVSYSATLLPRAEGYSGPLKQTGGDDMFTLFPKAEIESEHHILENVRNILWHDRDEKTFGFNPKVAEKTCSKSGCHPEELKQFKQTVMGRNFRQRTMRTWLKPYGPHNCGPSFADLSPPEELEKSGFDYTNTEQIMKDLNIPFSKKQAIDKQKFCNICHAGCLDCHYRPSKKEGTHAFTKRPDSLSCSGYGRGASTCHPGAMMSRRGETYIGGDYSIPQGMKPDVHYEKGIHCIDCHQTGEKGMGDIERKASCMDCHLETEASHSEGIHRGLDCAACHIKQLGGYQITVWGPGHVAGKETPFKKYALYYGIQEPPIIMKDQNGKWMPVKVWPHSVGNIKVDVSSSPSLQFRWPDGQTRDAYYTVGTIDNLTGNNKHLLWVEIEQAAHSFGEARNCESCHNSETQISFSNWEFSDYDGAEPFIGRHKIIADSTGIRFIDIKNLDPIILLPGAKLIDFASWIYLEDKWQVPGDFSIKTDKEKYLKYKKSYDQIYKKLEQIDTLSNGFDRKRKRLYREVRVKSLHDIERAEKILAQYLSKYLNP